MAGGLMNPATIIILTGNGFLQIPKGNEAKCQFIANPGPASGPLQIQIIPKLFTVPGNFNPVRDRVSLHALYTPDVTGAQSRLNIEHRLTNDDFKFKSEAVPI